MKGNTPTFSEGEAEALVVRRLRGELDGAAAARLAAALEADPALARRAAHFERTWQALELPPGGEGESVAPLLLARLRQEGAPSGSPAWARLAAAAALALGLGAGWNLDLGLDPPATGAPEIVENDADLFDEEAGLAAGFAESLWLAAEDDLQDEGELQ